MGECSWQSCATASVCSVPHINQAKDQAFRSCMQGVSTLQQGKASVKIHTAYQQADGHLPRAAVGSRGKTAPK